MKKIVYIIIAIVIASCGKKEKQSDVKFIAQKTENHLVKATSEGYELLKMRCYACHNPKAKSHDEIIAPPLAAVKRRYGMLYKSRDSFIDAIAKWTLNPSKDKALMRGAVNRFNVMPKQPFKEEEVRKIAAYIYDNELEVPVWFVGFEKTMRPKGMRGMGMGRMKKD